MILRDYQLKCRKAVLEAFQESDSALIVAPTGCGKTVMFGDIIKCFFPKRAMIIAHRAELIWQAQERVKQVTGFGVDVEMGEYKANETHLSGKMANWFHGRPQVVVSTVQTHVAGGDGGGRMGKFNPMDFGLLIIDEAHHATSPSYIRIVDYYKTNPKLKVLGVTATPDRSDEEALGQVFETVAFDYEILDAIHDGWLVDIDWRPVYIESLDFSHMRTTAGDLNGADLAAEMEAEKNLLGVADATMDLIGDMQTLVFTSSVEHARLLSSIFNRYKAGCSSWVCGGTDKQERMTINSDFNAGKRQILCNCGTHTEGFDSPGVEAVVLARPTKSRSLCAQMIGRGTRPLPGVVDGHELDTPELRRQSIRNSAKTSCLIIDFVGNAGRHKLVTPLDVLGGKVSDRAITNAIAKAQKSGKPVRVAELLDEEELAILAEEKKKRELEEAARKARLTGKAKYSTSQADPFDILGISPVKTRGWDGNKQLTEKQRAFLKKSGVDPDTIDYAKAKQLIGEMIGRFSKHLCTLGQARVLKRFGYSSDLTFQEASATIDAIAKNGWRRPLVTPTVPVLAVAGDDNIPF